MNDDNSYCVHFDSTSELNLPEIVPPFNCQITVTGYGRDPESDDHASFNKILTFHLTDYTQIAVRISSTPDDDVPAEFTLMKECLDGTTGAVRERRKIRGANETGEGHR